MTTIEIYIKLDKVKVFQDFQRPCTIYGIEGKYAAIRDLGVITGKVSWVNTIVAELDDSGNFVRFL